MTDQPQSLVLTLEFKTRHNPGDLAHLNAIATNYFKSKGVDYKDGVVSV